MSLTSELRIAVIPGDGIGQEIMAACLTILETIQNRTQGFKLVFDHYEIGAGLYQRTGVDMRDEDFKAIGKADAILLGSIGLPGIRYEDGTEISPHLRIRDEFGLYAGIRPVKYYPNVPRRLLDDRSALIDFVVIRESTEGLFYTHGRGEIIDDLEARETLRITRPVSEKLFDTAFKVARQRKTRGGKGTVTCVDKANVFRAFAFFRKIFNERAALNPDIQVNYNYVDAQALDLIRRPWDFDVLVMENMFGDIISDLGGGLVGGMGMAPCAELGDHHGLFQPAHGSAPDIMGQDKANPLAMFLSAAMMLDWLAERHGIPQLAEAASLLHDAVYEGFESGRLSPMEFGGHQGMTDCTRTLLDILQTPLVEKVS
ncbi:isocitrate/isopropylmalate dehydrogenase family protein [Sedimenticola selenatireducens]|uniref:3-isopropylmalate dehydrogenase n=1 Tax=Sedimenticola selenatireducens TaxID=191960 RepID=A0A558DVZ8_9GAMM|nr:isocitrate/isopropylmalate family dehydrogenase [Sedimenticola selenatireducens]TVO77892.1 isocitrate/isopropylmalate dehydrogenase family protein [Sedimenticola selenatireducens]TVT65197.1 MAG: isocitrate/isopropylmalate dehydrogenase family protein [Sedimenticola selenatireducens]